MTSSDTATAATDKAGLGRDAVDAGAAPPARLLVIDDHVPNVDRGTGEPRMGRLLESLARHWTRVQVTFLARDEARAEQYAPAFEALGIEVVYAMPSWPDWFAARRGQFDAVLVSRPHNFEWIRPWVDKTQPQAVRMFDAESLFVRRLERTLPYVDAPARPVVRAQLDRDRGLEANGIGWADVVLAVSDDAANVARAIAPGTPTVIVRHAVDQPDRVPPFGEREGMVFYGGFVAGPGGPNEDAAIVAVEQVLPLIRPHVSDTFRIIGADPTEAVRSLASDEVEVVGLVPDPGEWLQRARVHLSPLRFGAGLKLRFVDTMAAGLPFVTSTIGAEDLGLSDALASVLVADGVAEQAKLAIRLATDESLWTDVSEQLRALARARYSFEAFDASVLEAMLHAGLPPDRLRSPP
jgi:glycosyltransferase involved in cell wall biosynthesis